MSKIATVNVNTPYLGLKGKVSEIELGGGYNLLEYDLIIWSPSHTLYHTDNWKLVLSELKEFFASGRNLIIFYSVTDFSHCIPGLGGKIKIDTLKGNSTTFKGSKHNNHLKKLNLNNFEYQNYLNSSLGELSPILVTKEKEAVLSGWTEVLKGQCLLIPIYSSYYSKDSGNELLEDSKAFFDSFKLTVDSISCPSWFDNYVTKEESKLSEQNRKFQNDILDLNNQIEKNIHKIADARKVRLLMVADGEALELLVKEAFEELQFNASKGEEGRVDLLLEYQGQVSVCEVKGLGGSAGEKNIRQVETWKGLYEDKNAITPKGILVVNTFKTKAPHERTDPSFPEPMMEYVRVAKTCLLTTIQLYNILMHVRANPNERHDLVIKIFETVGRFSGFEEIKPAN